MAAWTPDTSWDREPTRKGKKARHQHQSRGQFFSRSFLSRDGLSERRTTQPVLPDPRYNFVSVPLWPHPLKYAHVMPGFSNWAFQSIKRSPSPTRTPLLHESLTVKMSQPTQEEMDGEYCFGVKIVDDIVSYFLIFRESFSRRVQRGILAVWRPGRR